MHEDNTDLGIAEVIARVGIPKSKIVLGFWAVYWREVSKYVVALLKEFYTSLLP